MHPLPEFHEFLEVLRRCVQDFSHGASLRISRTYCVSTISEPDISVGGQVNYYLSFAIETVYVSWLVILWIHPKCHTTYTERHSGIINPIRLGYVNYFFNFMKINDLVESACNIYCLTGQFVLGRPLPPLKIFFKTLLQCDLNPL
jgi:hypothetical protein